ncbi:MAG: 50S ribosomal protein L17 [Verrucomicrobiae bacterium]|nr:50S ribosomal protein L17 [Verrucomicrobiae bacterium]
MRHRQKTAKFFRTTSHRDAMLRNMACSLIEHRRIKTTLAKAKALRPFAEKLVTIGKKDSVHSRRHAISLLGSNELAQRVTQTLFGEIAPAHADRQGGYCRITKLGQRKSDSAPMAFIEWVDAYVPKGAEEATEEAAA